jgi:uncharacterized repeat protein (TIGR01451 family)
VNKILTMSKKAAIYIAAIMFGFSTAALASGTVPMEGSLKVANATDGDTTYSDSVSASSGDIVKVELWYHNQEPMTTGDIAKDVNIKINIPSTSTSDHNITSTVKGTNTNQVSSSTHVYTAYNATLEYIPGTAYRRYNTGTNANPNIVTKKISDSVVSTGYTISEMKPCWNYQETITVQARVTNVQIPVLSVVKQVKIEGASTWSTSITAKPGDTIAYLITVKNEGTTTLNNVIVRDSLPPKLDYIEGSAKLTDSIHPSGVTVSDNVINGGINVGNYEPGALAYVRLSAVVPATATEGGLYTFTNIGVGKADGLGEFYNTAKVAVNYPELTDYKIKAIKYEDLDGDGIKDSNESYISNWTMTLTGNGVNKTVKTNSNGEAVFSGLSIGTYTVTEGTLSGWKNITPLTQTVTIEKGATNKEYVVCFGNQKLVPGETTTTIVTPTTIIEGKGNLPISGPVEAAAGTFATIGLSGAGYYYWKSKKALFGALRKF